MERRALADNNCQGLFMGNPLQREGVVRYTLNRRYYQVITQIAST